MKKRDRKALAAYVRTCADTIELRDWTITVGAEPAPSDADGYVVITYGRKLAYITFAEDFRSFDPDRQRHTVAHELIHCHLEPACNMVQNDLEPHLAAQGDQVFFAGFKRQIEYGVDALAAAMAKHLPHIGWPRA